MPLHLVTGVSGAGKTTTVRELRRRGIHAVGSDEDGISCWVNAATGERADRPEPSGRTAQWLSDHRWVMSRTALEELAAAAGPADVFVCGGAANEDEVWDLFTHAFALHASEQTIAQRIASRADNDFGQSPHEWEQVLGYHRTALSNYARFGYVVIDAEQSIEAVVDELVAAAQVQAGPPGRPEPESMHGPAT